MDASACQRPRPLQGHHLATDPLEPRAAGALLAAPGAVILSGYAHEVYDPLILAGWARIDWQTACHAAGKTRHTGIQGAGSATAKQPRTESVWLNPVLQDRLGRQRELELEVANG